jgi:hypothetical protein
MKIKLSETTPIQIDYLVAKCKGFGPDQYMRNIDIRYNVAGKVSCLLVPIDRTYTYWAPSTNWSQGGPIIERERIAIKENEYGWWFARIARGKWVRGKTPMIAAMRCLVASQLGDQIEVPDELL